MTIYRRKAVLRVTIDGREVTQPLSFSARYDLAGQIPEAQITVPVLPSWAVCYDPNAGSGSVVSVVAGPDEAHAYGRFLGFLVEVDRDLYPRTVTLICRGLLLKADLYEQGDPDEVDMTATGTGQTDQVQAGAVLDACGLSEADVAAYGGGRAIGGTGRILGKASYGVDGSGALTSPFTWRYGESALAYLSRLDEACYPYRTFEFGPGQIYRGSIHLDNASTALTFEEGVNIFAGARSSEVWLDLKNQMAVTGWTDESGLGAVTYSYPTTAPVPCRVEPFSSDMLEYDTEAAATAAGDGLSCEYAATQRYPDWFRALVKIDLETPEGDPIYPTMPVKLQGAGGIVDRLGISAVVWVQAVECSIGENGEWTQHLTVLGSKRSTVAPTDQPPLPSFSLTLDQETIVSGGAEVTLYTVHVEDTSAPMAAPITGWSWTFTGGTPASAATREATTSYTDPAGKTITLEVTASDTQTATVTKSLPPATSVLWVRRPLYHAAHTAAEAFDGASNRSVAETGCDVVSNGPVWAAGDTVYRSTDYLATAPSSSQPKAGTNVSSLWEETDISTSRVLAGLADGSVYLSLDGGATWTSLGSPEASPILRVVINRYAQSQYFALTAAGYYDTVDGGASWSCRNPAPAGVTWYDVAHSWDRAYLVAGDDGAGNPYAEDSTQTAQTFTGATAGCYAVTARIKGGYAVILSDGSTWLSESGSADFAAATALPAGCTPLPRSLWRDGMLADLYYFAAGTSGAWKSIDGFGSADGYFQIRKPGVGTSPIDAVYKQVGADGLLTPATITPTTIYSQTTASDPNIKAKSLWNGSGNDAPPSGWNQPGFDTSAWAAAVAANTETGEDEIGGSTPIWGSVSPASGSEDCLLRQAFTLPAGYVASATLTVQVDDLCPGLWINGVFVWSLLSGASASAIQAPATVALPPSLLFAGGTNVIAAWGRNAYPAYACVMWKLEVS